MGLFLTSYPGACLRHFCPLFSMRILCTANKHVSPFPAYFKLATAHTFCTNVENGGVEINRKEPKTRDFVPRERNGALRSVFAAGTAKKTAVFLKKKYGCSESMDKTDGHSRCKILSAVPDRPLTASEWRKLKESSTRSEGFEQHIMKTLLMAGADINIAKSLLAYVALDTGTVSYELLLRYLALCVHGGHQSEVFDVYDIMRTRFRTLDTGAYSLFLKGFSRTARWRESLTLLQSMKKIITPSPRNYGDAITGAVLHGDSTTAWALYDELMNEGLSPSQDSLQVLFQSDQSNEDKLLSVLLYMRDYQIYPEETLATVIKSWFESRQDQKWVGRLTTVQPSGVCRCCGSELESIHLSDAEYGHLKDRVMKDVIKGRDVFTKTTPEELESFKQFVHRKPPFDVVIDGLNVANASGRGNLSEMLLAVVSNLAQQGNAILVLGRKHMLQPSRSWDRHHMQLIQQKAHCFFTENISEDDPFLLYAALHSGNHCKFVSRDLMRDHKACMSDRGLKHLFFKWQRGHQLVLNPCVPGRKIRFQNIPCHDTIVQSTMRSWHIPYDEQGLQRSTYEVPQKWMCLIKIH
ncbi:mitochondrial ribonuclease P catalytic subunit isoform X1 [Denticeps clupeoides]|uniref:mitochondrial ribonuclease P catalytic subunit isoform X1 n=3 Tax=Denticeps clupeoides TaxID=299321 RepID=UPI0010A4BF31|nr:mitochondrial ribonuclease P catalytic subunit isoform X1 [Denticeps clupeoides]